jgi:penicillin amidase
LTYAVDDVWLVNRVYGRGPFPWGGDANTIGQAAADPADPTSNPLWIASLRMVVEVGDWEGARFVLPGGQSGNPLSPHYDDMLPLWLRGDGVPIAWSPEAVERATRSTLRLAPGA